MQSLDQGEEPGLAGDEAGSRGGLVEIGLKAKK
jgi:hypothetical protein